jgi:pimeloyl-ACP methyl ester carboxylesterase
VAEWVLRERFATDEGEIVWDTLGQGPPVVLVHGTPWSSWLWRRVAVRLAERFAVYVFDLLGFGASEKRPGQDVSLAGHGARLAALLEFWALDRPAVIAHDIGGAAVLRAHLLHHRPVSALALIDAVALAPWGSPFYRLVRDYGRITAPTLVIWGEADRWIPAARGAELAQRIPGARLELLAGAGHLVQEDRPDELARLLGEHLDSALA